MRMAGFGVLALIFAIAGSVSADDKDKFQGKWKAEKAVRNGEEAPAEQIAKMKIEFKGNLAIPQEDDKAEDEAEFTLDETKKPKTMDIKPKKGNEKLIEGIYEIDGDTLKICFGKMAGPRNLNQPPAATSC
jgi:uncharacterized protein (TIGR03067 family)